MGVSLNINNRNINLATAKGPRIETWETIDLDAGIVKDGLILQPQAMAELLSSIFKSRHLARNPVNISLSGLPFVYRTLELPRLKTSLLPEAIRRATQKEINLPIEDLYLNWQTIVNTCNEHRIFVLGVPRNPIDVLAHTLKLAEIQGPTLEIKPLALSRLAGQAEMVMVNFEADGADIIIISEGIPATLHTVIPKNNEAALEDKVNQLIEELTRTIDFYNLAHPEKSLLRDTPVMLTGSLVSEASTREMLLENLGHPVRSLDFPLKAPPEFSIADYAVNLGLLMASNGVRTPSKSDTTGYHDIHIDLLAARKQTLARPLSIRKVLTPIAVVGAIAILVPVSLLHTRAVSETAGLQMQLDNLNYNLYQERQALAEAEITQMEIDTLEMETATLQKERESLSGRGSLSKIIQFIISSLPAQATCTGINTSPEQLEVNGTAAERQGVLDYARTLEQKGQFTSVRISLIDETASEKDQGTGEITVFKIIIQR